MFCHECGEQLVDGAKFCSHCGTKTQKSECPEAAQLLADYATSNDDAMPALVTDKPRSSNQANSKGQNQPDVPSRQLKGTDDLRILLVGQTGHGKSATGNSLLGISSDEGFHDEMSVQSVTKTKKRLTKRRFGRTINVIDTPGLGDTDCYQEELVFEELAKLIGLTLPGFHAIFLVLQPGRFSEQIVKTVKTVFKFLGTGVGDYAFVIFTHFETEADFKKFIQNDSRNPKDKGREAFEYLKSSCQQKMFFINNKAQINLKDKMVWDILNAVEEANASAPQPYFQNNHTERIMQTAKEFYRVHVCPQGAERSKEDLRILLIGLPGHGKSATGNSFLGENMFTEKESSVGEASIQVKDGKIYGRKITVVEFPMNSNQQNVQIRQLVLDAEKMLHPGFHAVCFVVDPYKMSEVKGQFQLIMGFFEELASDYAFVMMTRTPNEEECDRHVPTKRNPKGPGVTSVFEFCKDKALFIDNKALPEVKDQMKKEILSRIDSTNASKSIPYFSSKFRVQAEADEAAAQEQRRRESEAILAYQLRKIREDSDSDSDDEKKCSVS